MTAYEVRISDWSSDVCSSDLDVQQDFASIAPYTIEEAYEVADAIERRDLPALKDELGDLLLQVVYHSQMASEAGAFSIDAVISAVTDKMSRRHPHVFGEGASAGRENSKAAERASSSRHGALEGVALALHALQRAEEFHGSEQRRVGEGGGRRCETGWAP